MKHRVFIDGRSGTTGLQIHARLEKRAEIELVVIDDDARRDAAARRDAYERSDIVVLCLPDDAAREAAAIADMVGVRVIDASSAHRVAPDWVYGFPELAPGQRHEIARAKRVSNPGCYPTGFLALMRPLVDAGLVPTGYPVTVNAVSGYTGGGKAMVAEFEGEGAPASRAYALHLGHKHLSEMQAHAGLARAPIFFPSVARFPQGMLVEIGLYLDDLPSKPSLADIHGVLQKRYAGEALVAVTPADRLSEIKTLEPESMAGANDVRLFVFGDQAGRQARLVAMLDNLGKGASGAAVQNLNLMLGFHERAGL